MTSPHDLLSWFSPPEGYVGVCGWMAGYSADSDFLNEAVRCFGRRDGQIALALMLDRHQLQIPPAATPGVLHLLALAQANTRPDFRLQHAKIALLGFKEESGASFCVRLIVSTGNWQRATLESSLDLAWSIEVGTDDIKSGDVDVVQRQVDLYAAWDFLVWLRDRYDWRAIADGKKEQVSAPFQEFEDWMQRLGKAKGPVSPRFFDSRKRSLLKQLPGLVDQCGVRASNCLMLGSGFYEAPSQDSALPVTLKGLVDALRERESPLLTAQPWVEIYVNPEHCQAIARNLDVIASQPGDWSVFTSIPSDFLGSQNGSIRTLHAKFIFGAQYRSSSSRCLNAWVYMGSGNLTRHGFLLSAEEGGNLEAGVVFVPRPALHWEEGIQAPALSRFLPVNNGRRHSAECSELNTESDTPFELPEAVVAPPCAWLDWYPASFADSSGGSACGGWLQLPEPAPLTAPHVLDDAGFPCTYDALSGYHWKGPQPRQVRVRWRDGDDNRQREAWVPVRFQGRFASTPLRTGLGFEELLAALRSNGSDEDDEADDAHGARQAAGSGRTQSYDATKPRDFFIRNTMILLETIAQQQTALGPHMWLDWCERLRHVLADRGFDGPLAQDMRNSGLNLLAPLRLPAFRPDFAVDGTSKAGVYYENVLTHIEQQWGVEGLPRLGDIN